MRTTKTLLQKITCYAALFGMAGTASTAAAQAAVIMEKPAQSAESFEQSVEQSETPVVAQLPDSPSATVSKRQATMAQSGGSSELPDARVSMQRLALQTQLDPPQTPA